VSVDQGELAAPAEVDRSDVVAQTPVLVAFVPHPLDVMLPRPQAQDLLRRREFDVGDGTLDAPAHFFRTLAARDEDEAAIPHIGVFDVPQAGDLTDCVVGFEALRPADLLVPVEGFNSCRRHISSSCFNDPLIYKTRKGRFGYLFPDCSHIATTLYLWQDIKKSRKKLPIV
jgi:hypothetical protein